MFMRILTARVIHVLTTDNVTPRHAWVRAEKIFQTRIGWVAVALT